MDEVKAGLGVDFGGVIHGITYRPGVPDTFLEGAFEEAMATPAMPGAMEALARLVDAFGDRAWVVSKCGPRVQRLTEAWLERHDFYGLTGISSSHVVFCRQRPEKALWCAQLGLTHFVDDRTDVLEAMKGIVPYRFMFASRGGPMPPGAWRASNWNEVEGQIMMTLEPEQVLGTAQDVKTWRA